MSTFEALSNQLESQFGLGENANRSLADVHNGVNNAYGKLGDFSGEFDHSAERNYLEEGYLRYDPFTTNPKIKEVIWQQPEATILIKKKMFSALAENYNSAYMDKDEKVFLKASKILFQNKCKQISAYEKLCKLDKMVEATEKLNSDVIPLLLSLSNQVFGNDSITSNLDPEANKLKNNPFQQVIEKVRKIYTYNKSGKFTDWIQLANSINKYTTGDGTGVIELTNFTQVSTQVGISPGSGSCSFSISDPFGLMRITEHDIELAIADTTNRYYNKSFFNSQTRDADSIINKSINRLNERRKLRGASELSFKINADTLFGKKITVIVDRVGKEILFEHSIGKVDVDQEFLYGGGTLGTDGLIDPKLQPEAIGNNKTRKQYPADKASGISNELDDFKSIISLVYNKIALDSNSKNSIFQNNKDTNPLRKKMRMHFLGKLIIQPMDSVHVSFTSRTIADDKIVGGLKSNYTGIDVLQKLSNNISEIKNSIQGTILPSGNIDLEAEKAVFVGSDFPSSTWMMIRNMFVSDVDGTHCFAGLVNTARLSYNAQGGAYSVSVSCSDNMKYLEMGKVNFNPGADNFVGSLFDPLTPFKTDFDSISSSEKDNKRDLLDENKILLSSQMQGIIKHKNGPAAGSVAKANNLSQDITIDKTGKISTKYYAPDGLVYKWKEGISTLTQYGSSLDLYDPSRTGDQKLSAEGFAGQDVMNTISLLITGIPYNYATYYKAVIETEGIPKDPDTNKSSAHSYYQSLSNDLKKRNALWGNFVPFKNIVMDEDTYGKVLSAQFNIANFSTKLDQNLKQVSQLQQDSNFFLKADSASTGRDETLNKIALQVSKLKQQGDKIRKDLLDSTSRNLKIVGNDVSVDNDFLINSNSGRNYNDPSYKKTIRKKMNHLTRRFTWSIRANEDKNLFIVDDTYDKDYDIAAFQKNLAGKMELYSSEFLSVKDKILSVANLLNLEVFCDTQGHIRIRPPQYNKIPSSIFYNMMLLKKQKGIEIFPKYLENLYKDQVSALALRIGMIEDELRLMIALMDTYPGPINNKVLEGVINSLTKSSMGSAKFQFLTELGTGEIFKLSDVLKLNPENNKQDQVSFDEILSKVKNQLNLSNAFTAADRYQFVASVTNIPGITEGTDLDTIKSRLSSKYGVTVDLSKYTYTKKQINQSAVKTVDLYKVTEEVMQKLADRQKLVSKLSSSIKNLQEYQTLENGSTVVFNSFSPNKNVPEMLEHMIEDESFDDYGPGSGSRYVIKNKHILSYECSENPPPYTMVQVNGVLSDLGVQGPSGLNNTLPGGGNGMSSAVAIDYDMWKIYGMNSSVQPVNVPFLNEPDTQCAPYAATILSRNRRNILRAGMTVVGNEYMQPGEVVYVEQLGLLYYIESVSHSFTYGSFATTLVLSYGHTPGEYIPTTLDVIGKLLYNNRDISSYEINRQNNSFNESHLTSFLITPSEKDNNIGTTINLTDDNYKKIFNAMFTSAFAINSNSSKSNNVLAKVELRYYYDGKSRVTSDNKMQEVAVYIKKVMTGRIRLSSNKMNQYSNNLDSVPVFEDSQVEIVPVKLDEPTDYKSASQMAWNLARNYLSSYPSAVVAREKSKNSSATENYDKQAFLLKDALYGGVIDCYVKFSHLV